MTNYVYDNIALPALKAGNKYPVTDASRQVSYTDINAFITSIGDIINVVRSTSVNAAAYGAVGDGVTNDAPAIQAAMDAVAAVNATTGAYGGFVDLGGGPYLIGQKLVARNGVGLRGTVPSRAILRCSSTFSDTAMIENFGQTGIQEYMFLESILFDGNQGNGAVCSDAVVQWLSIFVNSWMYNCVVQGGSNVGLRVAAKGTPGGMGPILFKNNWINNTIGEGLVVEETGANTGACAGIYFDHIVVENQGSNKPAIRLSGSGHSTQYHLKNVHIEMGNGATNRIGIQLDGAAHTLIDGVQLLQGAGTTTAGIQITNVASNVGIQIRGVTNENLINPVIQDLKNGVTFGAINVPIYVTPDVAWRGGARFIPTSTGISLAAQDSSGTDRAWFDNNGRLTGSSVFGAGVDVKADAVNNRALVITDNAATRAWGFFFPDASNVRFRNFTGGVDLFNFDNAGNGFIYNPITMQFAATFQSGTVNNATERMLGELTPAAIAANQNDYSPSGLANAAVLIVSATAPFNITGLATPTTGRRLTVYNNSANAITLTHQDALSTAANRFIGRGGANTVLTANTGVNLYYSQSLTRWLIVGDTL
jgi:hypothetical protein